MDIEQIYDKVVLPPLRKTTRLDSLRLAWKKRILHEGHLIEKWSVRGGKTIGKKDAMQSPEFEKFLSEKRPQLLWDMEIDCFEVGDQQKSALRMLKHLEANLTHKDAPEWIEDFKGLISLKKQ